MKITAVRSIMSYICSSRLLSNSKGQKNIQNWKRILTKRKKTEQRRACVVGGRCQAHTVPGNVHQLHVQQTSTYEKPEAASAVLGS